MARADRSDQAGGGADTSQVRSFTPLRRRDEARRLSAFAEDVLEVIEAAAHESAIERLAGFAVVALPAAALDALRESLVGRDECPVHVQIFVARGIGVARTEAGARQEAKRSPQEGRPVAAPEHEISRTIRIIGRHLDVTELG